MRLALATGLLALPFSASADWFTVIGDPTQVDTETVQVNPIALSRTPSVRIMDVRVNRATARTSWEGVPYRSYEAQVRFLCDEGRADYRRIVFYAAPLWQGPSHHRNDYDEASAPPMLFKDMTPNPTQRIVRAACTHE